MSLLDCIFPKAIPEPKNARLVSFGPPLKCDESKLEYNHRYYEKNREKLKERERDRYRKRA